jgi:hypothetical protein
MTTIVKGKLLLVDDVLFRAEEDFNIYLAHDIYALNPDETDEYGFLNYLEEQGHALEVPVPETTDTTVELDGDLEAELAADNIYSEAYFKSSEMPPMPSMTEATLLVNPNTSLVRRQLEILARNLYTVFDTDDAIDGPQTLRDILGAVPAKDRVHADGFYKEVLVTIGMIAYREMLEEKKRKHGYVVQSVFNNEENALQLAYTIGVMERNGFEMYGAVSNIPCKVIGNLINTICQDPDTYFPIVSGSVFTLDDFKINGESIRTKLVKVDPETTQEVSLALTRIDSLYQLYMADSNNVLPDEPGYQHDKFHQPLATALKGKMIMSDYPLDDLGDDFDPTAEGDYAERFDKGEFKGMTKEKIKALYLAEEVDEVRAEEELETARLDELDDDKY